MTAMAPQPQPHGLSFGMIDDPRLPLTVLTTTGGVSWRSGWPQPGDAVVAVLPPLYPEMLGAETFRSAHGVRFAYIAGEMANGIAGPDLVAAMADVGALGFLGAGGLPLPQVAAEVEELKRRLGGRAFGVNVIHSPDDPDRERALVDLLLEAGVARMSASAFVTLTPQVARFAAKGLSTDAQGRVIRRHHVFAKVSRAEVAAAFMAPPPPAMLDALVAEGALTAQEAALASRLPVAGDVTAEADSGGHTDNRPLTVLLPRLITLADEVARRHDLAEAARVGAAGGIATPQAAAAAFAMGAAYVLTGSLNQCTVEARQSAAVKDLLAAADESDVAMAPAGDMFEMGARVQVLKRGTLFASRATRLADLYRTGTTADALSADDQAWLEQTIFRRSLAEEWAAVEAYFAGHPQSPAAHAAADPRRKLALLIRSYLGRASRWAQAGDSTRAADFQVWCGPAMGAANRWLAGSPFEAPDQRRAGQLALNIMEGAALATRAAQTRACGVPRVVADLHPRLLALA